LPSFILSSISCSALFKSQFHRGDYPPADEYLSYAEKSNTSLVEAFKAMQVSDEDLPVENGDSGHEVLSIFLSKYLYGSSMIFLNDTLILSGQCTSCPLNEVKE
jgi:hypothetical protein